MSGQKTRFGFAGSGEPPTEIGQMQSARTVLGHDIHLPAQTLPSPSSKRPSPSPDAPPPATDHAPASVPLSNDTDLGVPHNKQGVPPSILVAEQPKEATKRMPVPITEARANLDPLSPEPKHSGKSAYPTIAKIFGRWTTGGSFRRQSQLDARRPNDLVPAKDITGRNIFLLVVVAVLSFTAVMLLVRLPACQDDYDRATFPVEPPARPAAPKPAATGVGTPQPAPRPAPSPQPSSAEIATMKAALRPQAEAAQSKPATPSPGPRPSVTTPATRKNSKLGQPDNPDGLLPLAL